MRKPHQETIVVNRRTIAVVKMSVRDKSITRRVKVQSACATQSGACLTYQGVIKK